MIDKPTKKNSCTTHFNDITIRSPDMSVLFAIRVDNNKVISTNNSSKSNLCKSQKCEILKNW